MLMLEHPEFDTNQITSGSNISQLPEVMPSSPPFTLARSKVVLAHLHPLSLAPHNLFRQRKHALLGFQFFFPAP